VLWLRIDADLALIGRIKDRVEKLSSALGFKGEVRDFIPHLTVARARKGVALPEELVRYVEQRGRTLLGESFFSRLVLYSSKLTPDGPVYTELHSIAL
jgi:2'-5' RNA ligase